MEPPKRKIGYDKKAEKPKGEDWDGRSKRILAWLSTHPMFDTREMFRQINESIEEVFVKEKSKPLSPEIIKKIEPIIKKYGYRGY